MVPRYPSPMAPNPKAPRSALAIYAHPDDAELACGGTLATWAAEGTTVHIVVVCRGDKGSSVPVDPDQLSTVREAESRKAALLLGAHEWQCLGHNDGELSESDLLRRELVRLVRTLRPEVVLTADPTSVFLGPGYFNHRDHRVVGWSVLDAVSPGSSNPNYFPDLGAAHQVQRVLLSASLEPDFWVDVSSGVDAKVLAVLAHETQLVGGSELGVDASLVGEMIRSRASVEAKGTSLQLAEKFRQLRLVQDE